MSETELYYHYAEECRRLAAAMKDAKHKNQLEVMADAWTLVADEHKQMPRKVQAETHYRWSQETRRSQMRQRRVKK